MDLSLPLSIIALILGIINTAWLIINFILTKAPVIEYHFEESIRPKEVRFYLSNIGQVKGKLTELKIFDPIDKKFVNILFEPEIQNLYPQQRTHRDFSIEYKMFCKESQTQWIDLHFQAKIRLKILFLSKKFNYPRVYTVKCK